MANNKTTVVIGADTTELVDHVKKAEQSLNNFGDALKGAEKPVKEFPPMLTAAEHELAEFEKKLKQTSNTTKGFDGNQRKAKKSIADLETPLRDTEGAMARAQMAFLEFGNTGATAADKVGAAFLLAGDGIASFMTGGPAGIAIAAAVAGFSIINHLMTEEAEKAKEAEEAQKKHAEQLANVGKAAVDAGISIAALQAKEAAGIALAEVRAVEQERLDQRLKQRRLKDQLEDLRDQERSASNFTEIARAQRLLKAKAAESAAQDIVVKGMKNRLHFAKLGAKDAQAAYLNDLKLSSESAVTAFVVSSTKTTKAAASVLMAVHDETNKTAVKASKQRTQEAKKSIFDLAAFERKVRLDNRAFDQSEAEFADQLRREEQQKKFEAFQAEMDQQKRLAKFGEDIAKQRQASFMKVNAVQIASVNAVISGLQKMAHDGEISFAALGDAAFTAAGNELVASGTKHLMAGAAKAFGGLASGNAIAVSAGSAEAAQGGAMITAGLGMGAIGGAIGRSSSPGAAPQASTTPTDTRETMAASGSGDSGGGTVIVNFNGPAYDRRSVANVITSGQRMAKHRRIAGA